MENKDSIREQIGVIAHCAFMNENYGLYGIIGELMKNEI
jgi:hypothetical protein